MYSQRTRKTENDATMERCISICCRLFSQDGTNLKWVDGGKQLFQVNLDVVSTIYSVDVHLNNFFDSCQRFYSSTTSGDADITKYLKVSVGSRISPPSCTLPIPIIPIIESHYSNPTNPFLVLWDANQESGRNQHSAAIRLP